VTINSGEIVSSENTAAALKDLMALQEIMASVV
jgi:hypothetical protein